MLLFIMFDPKLEKILLFSINSKKKLLILAEKNSVIVFDLKILNY